MSASVITQSNQATNLRTFGAKGDGVTDDTAALTRALASGISVTARAGDTYLIDGGLEVTTVSQLIDMTGATVKLKNSATSKTMLTLSASGARVVGGTWDMNATNNTGGDSFGYAAVALHADYTVAESMYIHDSWGIGVKGRPNTNYIEVRGCRIENCRTYGVFLDGPTTADALGARITDCTVVVATTTARAIYISSNGPYTYTSRRWIVQGNTLVGPSSTSTAVGITGRGLDGVVNGNQVVNFDIGISLDIQSDIRCVVSSNRVENDYSGYGGIEVNGGKSTIIGNYVRGHTYGVVGSTNAGTGVSMDGRVISGNRLENQTTYPIYIIPATGDTARRQNIVGNTITATTAISGFIRMSKDCQYSLISGNIIKGAGSSGSRGVYLDTVPGNVAIIGNRFAGLQRTATLYNNTATAYVNVLFADNDVSEDIGSTDSGWLNLEGTATYGAGIKIQNNFTGESTTIDRQLIDGTNNIRDVRSSAITTPEASQTAGPGSTWQRTSDGKRWTKASGTGNTGWKPIAYVPRTAPTYGANVTIATLAYTGEFVITATNSTAFQIDNPTTPVSGARITIRIKNTSGGALGAITWDTAYKLATWTSPATGFSRAIDFQYDGTNWVEVSRTPADVPN